MSPSAKAADHQPPIRAVWLGAQLREMREKVKLTVRDVGRHVGKGGSTISRMETAQYPVTEKDVNGYLDMCGITDPHRRTDLLTICRDVAQRGWWNGYSSDVASNLMDIAWMESKATAINSVDMTFLPGLVQVPEYAETLMRAKNPDASDAEINRWVDMRMKRQHILTQHKPVMLSCIIAEQLLRTPVGDPDDWKQQLSYLVEVSARPNVEVRVLPTETCTGLEGPFQVFSLVEPYPTVALVATSAGDICVEGRPVGQLAGGYDRLQVKCHDPKASSKLITTVKDKL